MHDNHTRKFDMAESLSKSKEETKQGNKSNKQGKWFFSKIKEGLKTSFVSNKKVGNQFQYDLENYQLNFDDGGGNSSARFAPPCRLENRRSETQVNKESS